ncbi:nucleoside triphosphate pyrophosphohydrolase [Spirochaetia bacterium]|nr:nucleoside triphosphate pyrophosphohydrolase [Spirochaetia bacterium]
MSKTEDAFKALYDIVVRLRAPDGCPWDREQTPMSLRGDLIEETYECVEAIDQKDPAHIGEELGDIFLLVTMLAYMHEQEGSFTVADALTGVSEKLIRRHPHVFGEVKVKDSAEVLDNWAKIKVEQEGRKPKDSILDEVSRGLPPLDRAWKLQKKAAKAGFDWSEVKDVIGKIEEELGEVNEVLAHSNTVETAAGTVPGAIADSVIGKTASKEALEGELGDLLFSVVNLCRFLHVEPSVALQRTNVKFENRFKHVEKRMKETNQEMKQGNLAVMDKYWEEAKTVSKA